jgi:predicted nucleic acid-binding protein
VRTALDTNIISALWSEESSTAGILIQLRASLEGGSLVICPIVFVELFGHPLISLPQIHRFLQETRIAVDWEMGEEVWETAGSRFAAYANRRRQSQAEAPRRLPADFLIGAHALTAADRLLTLDQRRYRSAFPELHLVEC